MLAKRFKLPVREFLRKKTDSIRLDFFTIRHSPNNLSFSRFGIVVSKKVFAKAVLRNRLKRMIFNFIRENKYHLAAGYDVLIIAKPEISKFAGSLKEKTEEELKKFFRATILSAFPNS